MKHTIGGNVVIRNGLKYDYCFVPCILSMLPICDVINVCDSDSTDGTREILDDLAKRHSKIQVLNYPWKNPVGNVDAVLDWENWSRERLGTDYHLMLEADEVLGPESYDHILNAAQGDGKVLGMWRYNFWKNEKLTLAPGTILSPQVVRFAPTSFWLGGDAPHPKASQTEPAADWSALAHCKIYHYGFLRKQEAYLEKYREIMKIINGSEYADPSGSEKIRNAVKAGKDWMDEFQFPLQSFYGDHPPLALPWLKARGFAVEPRIPKPNAMSETAKYRHLTARYCQGCGVDVASQGDRVVPWAMSFDLPPAEFAIYCSNHPPKGPIHLRGHATALPFDSGSLDFVYSSHLLEDYLDWEPVLKEWVRVLRPGGTLIILVPDKKLWNEAIAKGQPPNCSHKHESYAGELSTYAERIGVTVVKDELTAQFEGDYSVLFVATKL